MNRLVDYRRIGAVGLTALNAGRDRQHVLNTLGEGLIALGHPKELVVFLPSVLIAWAESGFPTVEPSHKLSASLMCTAVPKELCDDTTLPWRCFHVAVPHGLLSDARDIFILRTRDSSAFNMLSIPVTSGGLVDMATEPSLAGYAEMDLLGDDTRPWPEDTISKDSFAREGRLIGRLLVGICVEFSTPRLVQQIARGPRSQSRSRDFPRSWVFKLTRDVAVDFRPLVNEYARGGGNQLNVQHCVRGHWKRQAVGEGRLDRKWIHVEPYWRGDPDSPIAQRSHLLT